MQQPAINFVNKYRGKTLDPMIVSREGEGERLWNHVLFGTGTCVSMIAGYASLGLPGDPLPKIYALIAKLNEVAKQLEEQHED